MPKIQTQMEVRAVMAPSPKYYKALTYIQKPPIYLLQSASPFLWSDQLNGCLGNRKITVCAIVSIVVTLQLLSGERGDHCAGPCQITITTTNKQKFRSHRNVEAKKERQRITEMWLSWS